jgi:hypothetical protein
MLPIETERARGCPVDAASLISPCAKSSKNSKPTGSKLVKGPAESEKFVRWKSMKNSEENS